MYYLRAQWYLLKYNVDMLFGNRPNILLSQYNTVSQPEIRRLLWHYSQLFG